MSSDNIISMRELRESYRAGRDSIMVRLIFDGIGYLIKLLCTLLTVTGLWPFVILIVILMVLFSISPSTYLALPIVVSFFFAIFWTGKNLLRSTGAIPLKNKPLKGVFFGIDSKSGTPAGKLLDKDGHILVVGGAGTGKSSCIAIPTLKYFWDGTFLAVDIKGELTEKSGREACIFNPSKAKAFGYDPFFIAHSVDNPVSQLRDIALTLVPEPPNVKDPFWVKAAQNVLTGHLVFSYKHNASFIQSLKKLQSVPPQRLIEVTASDEQAGMFVAQYLGIKSETLASIMSELSNHIIPFISDPQIAKALSKKKDTITPEILEEDRSIFLQIPGHKINQWKALITIIIQQFLTHFEQRPEGNNEPILFLIDEFARLGKMEGILNGLATLRSKKITIEIIIQSLAQLDATYGKEQRQIITDNCAYKAVLGATDSDTQKYFSALVGTHEVERESLTKDRKTSIIYHDVTSSTVSLVEKAIIRPEEFAYLKDIVLLTPEGFSRVRKQPYYEMTGRTELT